MQKVANWTKNIANSSCQKPKNPHGTKILTLENRLIIGKFRNFQSKNTFFWPDYLAGTPAFSTVYAAQRHETGIFFTIFASFAVKKLNRKERKDRKGHKEKWNTQ